MNVFTAAHTAQPGVARQALIVRGRLDAEELRALDAQVRAGASILIAPDPDDLCAAELTGVTVDDTFPSTEWYVTLADRAESARLDGEVPISSPLRLLRPIVDDVEVAATTSVRFRHHPTIVVRRLGDGIVVSTGVGDLDALHAHPTLGRFVDRLLRSAFPIGIGPSNRTLGVGVVGYGPFGGMGYLHGLAATQTDGLAFVAAADSAPERLVAAKGDFADLVGYGSATCLAADPAVDIAIIATPPVHHAGLALELLRAGKHVVIEKPMCLHAQDADLIIRTAAEHDRTVTVHQSRRWDRDWLAVRHVVDSAMIGEVFNIETFVGGFEHPCRAWHSEESVSGGAIYDWGSHHVDWIIQLYGSAPLRVLCTTHQRVWHDSTNVDQLTLWMQWADGREATFRQSDVCAIRRPKFHIQGDRGTAQGHYRPLRTDSVEPGVGYVERVSHHAEVPVNLDIAIYQGGYGIVESVVTPAPHPGWGFHRNLADHLLLGEPLAVRPEESRDVVRVLEAGQRSGASGGVLIELE